MSREYILSLTDFYTLSPVINEEVTHFHPQMSYISLTKTCPRPFTLAHMYNRTLIVDTQINAQKKIFSLTHKHTFTHTFHSLPRTLLPPEPPSTDRRSPRLLSDTSPRVRGQLSSVKSRGVLRALWCGWGGSDLGV